jgi:hypothetical protein
MNRKVYFYLGMTREKTEGLLPPESPNKKISKQKSLLF